MLVLSVKLNLMSQHRAAKIITEFDDAGQKR